MTFDAKLSKLAAVAKAERVTLPYPVALFIASEVNNAEWALGRVIAYASLTSQDITVELARKVLRTYLVSGNDRGPN